MASSLPCAAATASRSNVVWLVAMTQPSNTTLARGETRGMVGRNLQSTRKTNLALVMANAKEKALR